MPVNVSSPKYIQDRNEFIARHQHFNHPSQREAALKREARNNSYANHAYGQELGKQADDHADAAKLHKIDADAQGKSAEVVHTLDHFVSGGAGHNFHNAHQEYKKGRHLTAGSQIVQGTLKVGVSALLNAEDGIANASEAVGRLATAGAGKLGLNAAKAGSYAQTTAHIGLEGYHGLHTLDSIRRTGNMVNDSLKGPGKSAMRTLQAMSNRPTANPGSSIDVKH